MDFSKEFCVELHMKQMKFCMEYGYNILQGIFIKWIAKLKVKISLIDKCIFIEIYSINHKLRTFFISKIIIKKIIYHEIFYKKITGIIN